MLKVGLTGGIGTGKSMVAAVFATLGVPVFNADEAARHVMHHNADVKAAIIKLFGEHVYHNGEIVKKTVSDIVYKDGAKLELLNAIVHPATISYSKEWMQCQTAPYIIKEAAIFFESGSNNEMDIMIGVSAPLKLRIQRIIKRSGLGEDKIKTIMNSQLDNDEKMARCNFIITNDDVLPVIPQVLPLHNIFMKG
ncbi:MAG: dephospho-CoA kinase [Taibaiella sp.]|nr:dephospho-CoA kinase [Taibaiella sp.]